MPLIFGSLKEVGLSDTGLPVNKHRREFKSIRKNSPILKIISPIN
jgi:hypothetical protein